MDGDQRQTIEDLRDKGYAICIFTPYELRGASTKHVEDRLVEEGWTIIDCLATEPKG